MRIVAMDSSFSRGGVALLDGERVVARSAFEGEEGHVAMLPRELERLMRSSGWRMAEVERIAVTLGPGTFSGARIALGMAKGFALALGTPVVGFSTLEVVAAGAAESGWVATLLDARRGEVYAAVHEIRSCSDPVVRLAPGVWDPDGLAEALSRLREPFGARLTLTGNGLLAYVDRFQSLLDDGCELADPERWSLDVTLLGKMAFWSSLRASSHGLRPVEALEPMYLRRADAKEPQGTGVAGA
ncbi:MAG: tRNA (adenosine(37)-N6)-threonylcarbamoyltransferase complex dimerization subunit type 1 TsaB [Magnetococcales bacterium]|nr:tRNA (adenosine(37)-N6)-threonylcarbamoyltransferase complex dimerization subunit type 1 TsaB [Magnetococcales bacterium]